MSERIITSCDICNPEQSYSNLGTVEATEEDAIDYFDWVRLPDGKIKCLFCQDEEENNP